jgi:hypothetical protein
MYKKNWLTDLVDWDKKVEKKAGTFDYYEEMQALAMKAFAEEIKAGKDVSVQSDITGDMYIITLDFKPFIKGKYEEVKKKLEEKLAGVGKTSEVTDPQKEYDMMKLPVRQVSIENIKHPEWGAFGIYEDKGDFYEIHGEGGDRVLFKNEMGEWKVKDTTTVGEKKASDEVSTEKYECPACKTILSDTQALSGATGGPCPVCKYKGKFKEVKKEDKKAGYSTEDISKEKFLSMLKSNKYECVSASTEDMIGNPGKYIRKMVKFEMSDQTPPKLFASTGEGQQSDFMEFEQVGNKESSLNKESGKWYVNYKEDGKDERQYFKTESEALAFVKEREAKGDRTGYRNEDDDTNTEWLVWWMKGDSTGKLQKQIFTDERDAKKFVEQKDKEGYMTGYSTQQKGMGTKHKYSSLSKISWQGKLQDSYDKDFEQFKHYDETYGIAKRLGFSSAEEAWKANPVINVTSDPEDLKVVEKKSSEVPEKFKQLIEDLKSAKGEPDLEADVEKKYPAELVSEYRKWQKEQYGKMLTSDKKTDDEYAIRCFINGKRKFTHTFTLEQAKIFYDTAGVLRDYINEEYLSKKSSKKAEESHEDLNGYVAFYKGKKTEVWAKTSFEAQKKAAEFFKAKKSYEVTVMLAEKSDKPGEAVVHDPSELSGKQAEEFSPKTKELMESPDNKATTENIDKHLKELEDKGELPNQQVRVFDNGGETFDRYTIIFPDGWIVGSSENPNHPQGFWQHDKNIFEDLGLESIDQWIMGFDNPDYPEQTLENTLGKEVKVSDLPEAVQRQIKIDLEGKLNKSIKKAEETKDKSYYEEIVSHPGKFEGEKAYTPYFYDIAMDGGADDTVEGSDGTTYDAIDISIDDANLFPELKNSVGKYYILQYSSNGFVYGAIQSDKVRGL